MLESEPPPAITSTAPRFLAPPAVRATQLAVPPPGGNWPALEEPATGLLPRGTTLGGTPRHRMTQGDKRVTKFARKGVRGSNSLDSTT